MSSNSDNPSIENHVAASRGRRRRDAVPYPEPWVMPAAQPHVPLWKTRRVWVGGVVLGLWLGAMGLILNQERVRTGASLKRMGVSPEVLLVSWSNYDEWTSIERQGKPLGLEHTSIVAEEDKVDPQHRNPTFSITSQVRLKVPIMGFDLPIESYFRVETNPMFEMTGLQATLLLPGQTFDCTAFVEGKDLFYRIQARDPEGESNVGNAKGSVAGGAAQASQSLLAGLLPGGEQIGISPLDGPILLGDTVMPIVLQSDRLKAGEAWSTRVANPFFGSMDSVMNVRVIAREPLAQSEPKINVWKVVERMGDVEATAWYDDNGRVMRREAPGGMVLKHLGSAEATERDPNMRKHPPLPAIDAAYIKAHVTPGLRGKALGDLLPRLPGM